MYIIKINEDNIRENHMEFLELKNITSEIKNLTR